MDSTRTSENDTRSLNNDDPTAAVQPSQQLTNQTTYADSGFETWLINGHECQVSNTPAGTLVGIPLDTDAEAHVSVYFDPAIPPGELENEIERVAAVVEGVSENARIIEKEQAVAQANGGDA